MAKAPIRVLPGTLAIVIGLALLLWIGVEVLERRATQQAGRSELEGRLPPSEELLDSAPTPRPALGSVVGRIVISEAEVDAVALEGIDAKTLKRAVGHFPGTALPGERGNASFAAHRDSFFRGLRRVVVGQEVEIETPYAIHSYRIEETRVVEPTQVDVIDPRGGRQLTLITCYPFDYVGAAPQRFVVHARWLGEREREAEITGSSAPGRTAF